MASTKPRLRFRDSAIRLAAFVLLFSLCGCTYALVKGGEINQTEADSIRRQIQEIRELQFKRTVSTVVRTPEQVRGMIVADLKRDYTDEQLQADGKAGAMLAFIRAESTSRPRRSTSSRIRLRLFTIPIPRRWCSSRERSSSTSWPAPKSF